MLNTGANMLPRSHFRWSVWAKGLSGEALACFVRDEVFAFFGEMGASAAHNFMHGARLSIDDPTVLTLVVGLRLDQADADTKGDLFEHVLRQIKQAGELGQFRTPRRVIRAIVEMIDPKVGETVYDPAAGKPVFWWRPTTKCASRIRRPPPSLKPSWTASASAAAWAIGF